MFMVHTRLYATPGYAQWELAVEIASRGKFSLFPQSQVTSIVNLPYVN